MINVNNEPKILDSVRASIVDRPEKEIPVDEFIIDCKEASFMVCRHGKRSIEVFGANRNGWCDLNTSEFMDGCKIPNDNGFARVGKKITASNVIEKISMENGIENSVVYSYINMD